MIDSLPPPGKRYAEQLVQAGEITPAALTSMETAALEHLTKEFDRTDVVPAMTHLEPEWKP